MLNIDFHCHTKYSFDSKTDPEELILSAISKDLKAIAITDHADVDCEDQGLYWDFSFPGGETIQAFADRTRAALKDIFEAEKNTGSVAVFSHGGVLMSLMADIAGLDRSKAFRLWLSRGSLAKIVFDDSGASDGVHMQAGRLCMLLKPAEIFK